MAMCACFTCSHLAAPGSSQVLLMDGYGYYSPIRAWAASCLRVARL